MRNGRSIQMAGKAVTTEIYPELCKGCQLCIESCKFDVLEMSAERGRQGYLMPKVARLENCRKCMLCEMTCPDMAIELVEQV